VTKTVTIGGSIVLATAIGLGLFLRPRRVAREELPVSTYIPPAARQVVKSKMGRHDFQMQALVSRVALLDDDGVARVAGEIFDEPTIARPTGDDELNRLLPARFFELQDELRQRARRLVIASQRHDHGAIAEEFGALAKGCVTCHEVFLHGDGAAPTNTEPPR